MSEDRAFVQGDFCLLPSPDIWQDYDCPNCAIDFDLHDFDILVVGEQCYCSGCGQKHTAEDLNLQTYIRANSDNEEIDFRGVPKDAAEKAAWIAEARIK